MAFRRDILKTPSASVTVVTMGSPSGMAATARLTATVSVSSNGRPATTPQVAMRAIAALLKTAKRLPSSSILSWSGDLRAVTLSSSVATIPNSVEDPTATTSARPRPALTSVPAKAMLRCCGSGSAPIAPPIVPPIVLAMLPSPSPVLCTGRFSPVSDDSSILSSTLSTTRQSAGTRSPVESTIKSPTTSAFAGNPSLTRPSLSTVLVWGTRSASFSRAFSERYSWIAATSPTMKRAMPIEMASLVLPRAMLSTAEKSSIPMRGSLSCSLSWSATEQMHDQYFLYQRLGLFPPQEDRLFVFVLLLVVFVLLLLLLLL
mmetsp:Transcript_5060/g.14669  ORF Transcript_5060/g.14669 Transcript_5060/m.14669 type:complete len:317 (-) Transcript_5060:447-1397(-)